MASSHYPFSDEIPQMEHAKNIFGFFNIVQLSKFKMVNTVWNAFIDQHFLEFDDELKQKMQKVKEFLPNLHPYSSHFNLYYNKNAGFILDILKSTLGTHPYPNTNGLVSVLQDVLPFLKICNQESNPSDRMYFWSPDGFTFYQMQQDSRPAVDTGKVTVKFRTDEHGSTPTSCCQLQFSAARFFGTKEDLAKTKAVLLDSSSQPILEFERCPDHQVELLLYFIMQNKIRMIPLRSRKDTICLVPFGNYNDMLLVTHQKISGHYLLYIKENDVWRDLPCNYTVDFYEHDIKLVYIRFDHQVSNGIRLTLNQLYALTRCEMRLPDLTLSPLTPIDPIITEEILAGLVFLNRGVNPRPTPFDVIARPQPELLEDPDNLSKVNRLS